MSVSVGLWPLDFIPYAWEFYLRPNSQVFRSPVTRTTQAMEGQGQMWVGTGSFRLPVHTPEHRRKAQQFEGFVDQMKGAVNYAYVPDFADMGHALGPQADVTTLGQVKFTDTSGFADGSFFSGGSQTLKVYGNWPLGARSVLISGAPQGSLPLYTGDNVQLGNYLYRLLEDAVTNGLNRAYLRLNRGLMEAVDHGSSMVTRNARTPMRLVDDDQSKRSSDALRPVREYTLSFEELFFLNEPTMVYSAASEFSESENGAQGDFIVDANGRIWSLR
jgi:hypothetical protein